MNNNNNHHTDTFSFDSPEYFLNYIENLKINPQGCCGEDPKFNRPFSGWIDTNNYSEAVELAKHGDKKTAEQIKPKDIELSHHGRMTTTSYDNSGDFVDIGRYLSGEPECMGSNKRLGKPIINILVNNSAASSIKAHTIQARGKAILEIMSGLESNGYGVEITMCIKVVGQNSKYRQELFVKIKSSREYFNLHSLAFWLVSPSVLRRFYFKHVESLTTQQQKDIGNWGYGRPQDMEQAKLDAMPDCIYFPQVTDNNGSYEKAIKQIMEQYKA